MGRCNLRSLPAAVVAVGVALTLAAPAARAQQPPPAQPTLGDAVRDWWKKVPDPVKAKAKEQILAAMEMAFGGARTAPPPPPPAEPAKMTAKEKAAAEKARRAEIAKLKKLEAQRKAAEAKAMRAHAAAQRAAVAAAKAKGETPPVVVAPPPPLPTTTLHEVAVPLERRGSSYYVGARLNERQEVSFLYDTGASLSTVNQATLAQLGVPIPPDAPTQRTQTANGTVEQALVVLDTLDVGDVRIAGGFTVSVCEPCADGRKVGLLGLNFSRRFLVTLDEGAKKLRLVPRADLLDHRFDVEPFLAYEGVRGQVRGGSFYVTGTVRNRSPRTAVRVRVAGVLVDSSDKELGRISGAVGTVPAGGTVQFSIHGPARKFDKFYIELESADW